MGNINSRSKGARGEKMVVQLMKSWTSRDFARTPSSGGLQWKTANAKGDIVCTKEGHYFPFCIEVKNYEELNFQHLLYIEKPDIIKFWEQAERDAKICNKCPLLFMRYNGLPKNFFFVGIPSKIYYPIFSKYIKRPKLMALQHYDLVITTTKELLSVEYRVIRKLIKNYYKAQK